MGHIIGMTSAIQERAYMPSKQSLVQFGAVKAMRLLQLIDGPNRNGIQVQLGHLPHLLFQAHFGQNFQDPLIVGGFQGPTGNRPRMHISLSLHQGRRYHPCCKQKQEN
jgi:hypothetical protein